jgi:hypothetical protein
MQGPKTLAKAKAKTDTNISKEAAAQPQIDRYHVMYYKRSGAVAIRKNFGDCKQVFQISNKAKSRADLELIQRDAIAKLQNGGAVADVMAWARQRATQ